MLGAALVREQNSWGHRLQRCPRPRERSGPPRCLGKAEGGEGRVQPGGNRSRTLDLLMGGEEAPEPSSEHEENTNGHADKRKPKKRRLEGNRVSPGTGPFAETPTLRHPAPRDELQEETFPCGNHTAQNAPFRLKFEFYCAQETVLCKPPPQTLSADIFLVSIQTLFTSKHVKKANRRFGLVRTLEQKATQSLPSEAFKGSRDTPALASLGRSGAASLQKMLSSIKRNHFVGSTRQHFQRLPLEGQPCRVTSPRSTGPRIVVREHTDRQISARPYGHTSHPRTSPTVLGPCKDHEEHLEKQQWWCCPRALQDVTSAQNIVPFPRSHWSPAPQLLRSPNVQIPMFQLSAQTQAAASRFGQPVHYLRMTAPCGASTGDNGPVGPRRASEAVPWCCCSQQAMALPFPCKAPGLDFYEVLSNHSSRGLVLRLGWRGWDARPLRKDAGHILQEHRLGSLLPSRARKTSSSFVPMPKVTGTNTSSAAVHTVRPCRPRKHEDGDRSSSASMRAALLHRARWRRASTGELALLRVGLRRAVCTGTYTQPASTLRQRDMPKQLMYTIKFQRCIPVSPSDTDTLPGSSQLFGICKAAPTDSSALSVASVRPCDTSQGELPGNCTTSPLLLINFLKWPNHTEQFYRSSRNISGCPGEQAPTDAFFPGQSRCARGSGCQQLTQGRQK
ncbi:hypothetical protein Anapl_01956 [Anas platyrhynchos]|uniref:Uncharacterized protein n=1 Tax=Anas platyrhynchos TaxID=8839 RepID=R0M4D9_ANAPL|nr:hypothetical protein Anapl_01956 [Anas platyrhynchos]